MVTQAVVAGVLAAVGGLLLLGWFLRSVYEDNGWSGVVCTIGCMLLIVAFVLALPPVRYQ